MALRMRGKEIPYFPPGKVHIVGAATSRPIWTREADGMQPKFEVYRNGSGAKPTINFNVTKGDDYQTAFFSLSDARALGYWLLATAKEQQ